MKRWLFRRLSLVMMATTLIIYASWSQDSRSEPVWPEGKEIAISLTFDDGRESQVERGTDLLNEFGVKGTFYVVPSAVERNLNGWKQAVANGHEIGNHSLHHPCSGNFPWAREKALEEYSLEKMKTELLDANKRIEELLGVTCAVFAYPCGQTFVGRGVDTKSYVPVVATLFSSGRGWLDEGPNDPLFCDFAQLTGIESDGKNFDEIRPVIEAARKNRQWVVLAGHDIGIEGAQTTRLSMLKDLLEYAGNPDNKVWIAPVGTVTNYLQTVRQK